MSSRSIFLRVWIANSLSDAWATASRAGHRQELSATLHRDLAVVVNYSPSVVSILCLGRLESRVHLQMCDCRLRLLLSAACCARGLLDARWIHHRLLPRLPRGGHHRILHPAANRPQRFHQMTAIHPSNATVTGHSGARLLRLADGIPTQESSS